MTIEKGEAWGRPAGSELETETVDDDRQLALRAAEVRSTGDRLVATVRTGDLLRTLGLPPGRGPRPPAERLAFDVDLGWIAVDGRPPEPFVAHAAVRHPLWSGPFAVAMNAAFVDRWYLGPRAHPNDGLLDITFGSLSLRQRWLARRRLSTGSHLPHPDLTMVRRPRWAHEFARSVPVRVDHQRVGRGRRIELHVDPDALVVVA